MNSKQRKVPINTIHHDPFDRMAYEGIYSQSKDLQDITEKGLQVLKTFAPLGEDVFFALYKTTPELAGQDEMVEEYLFNAEQMVKLIESPSYQELRQYTQLDELGAGLGSKAMLYSLLKQLQEDESLKEATEKINKAVDKRAAANTIAKHSAEFEQAMAEARAAADNVRQLIGSMQSKLRQIAERAAESATGAVEQAESIILSWGFNKGEFARLPYGKKVDLLQVLRSQQKFREMTKLVGRMRNIAIASRKTKWEQQRVELHAITQGDDINHVLPQELLALRRPVLKLHFYRRMMEKQLMQYDLIHKECVGQGPIVALIDTSSSMRGDREAWSKAVALGLAEIAEKERRAFSYALFASRQDDLLTDDFQTGQRTPDKILRLATEFIGGGTDFEHPLTWAMGKLQESRFTKADIVLITDGECAISNQFLAELLKVKSEKKVRIYSILIGTNPHELSRWSDEVWNINDLLDDSTVKELFNKI